MSKQPLKYEVLTTTSFEESIEHGCLSVEKVTRVLENPEVTLTDVLNEPDEFDLTLSDISAYMSVGLEITEDDYLEAVSEVKTKVSADKKPETGKRVTRKPNLGLGYRFHTVALRNVIQLDDFAIEHREFTIMRLAFCKDSTVLWYEGINAATPTFRRVPKDKTFNWVRVEYLVNNTWEGYLLWSDWQGQELPVPIYAMADKELASKNYPLMVPVCYHDTFQSKVMVHSEIDRDGNLCKGRQTHEALNAVGFSY